MLADAPLINPEEKSSAGVPDLSMSGEHQRNTVSEKNRSMFDQTFYGLSTDEQRHYVEQTIRHILSNFLKIDLNQVKDVQPFFDCGMDSITAVDFSRLVGEAFRLEFHVDIIFDYPNLFTLTDYVMDRLSLDSSAQLDEDDVTIDELSQMLERELEND